MDTFIVNLWLMFNCIVNCVVSFVVYN